MNSNTPKYDSRVNPPYQIDWQNAAAGKKVAATKRRVKFRFGFSNKEALEKGLTGIEARGEEHEVSLVWSLTSGKRLVVMDGREVHFSMGRRADAKFEASWTMRGGHILKIIAHAAPPIRAIPGFKQFDLLLDGMSFFEMPRIFELGVKKNMPRSREVAIAAASPQSQSERGFSYKNYQVEDERRFAVSQVRGYDDDDDYSRRSLPMIESERSGSSRPARRSTMDIQPAPAASYPKTEAPAEDILSDSPIGLDMLESPTPQAATANVPDEFAPVVAPPQPPSFHTVANQIMSAYPQAQPQPAASPLALANESHTYYQPSTPPPYTQQQTQQQQYYQTTAYASQQTYYGAPPAMVSPDASTVASTGHYFPQQQQPLVVDPHVSRPEVAAPITPSTITPTMMEPLEVDELRDCPSPVDVMDKAVRDLVNLDDLNEAIATPEQIKARKQKKEACMKSNRSRPAPPVSTDWHVGQNASLADIQQHKQPTATPTKEVMRVHAFDPAAAQAGMMVVYGQQSVQQSPPQQSAYMVGGIPAVNGFGAGMYNGYQQQPLGAGY